MAVIDGATDKTGRTIDGAAGPRTTGRWAADTLVAIIGELGAGMDAYEAVETVVGRFGAAVRGEFGELTADRRPSASIAVYDDVTRTVWRVGDCPVRIGSDVHAAPKRIDVVTADFRAAYLAAHERAGNVGGPDLGREVILPLLRVQAKFANQEGEFGFGVIDGRPVPAVFVDVFAVPASVEVILASDGYPTLPATLAEAEQHLAELVAVDPTCVGPLRSTKGVSPGCLSFDDRAWIRLRSGGE